MRLRAALGLALLGCEGPAPVAVAPVPIPASVASVAAPSLVGGPDFSIVFERLAPSVVGVASGRSGDGPFEPDRFGSGFAWDATHVVTSDHVIGDGGALRVRTFDGRVRRARVVGRDEGTDLALLAVDGVVLPPAPRAPSAELRPGAWVAAIGNPYGLDHSITVGVVSALGRRNLPAGAPKYTDFVQSDASVNPGSSGGPLADAAGRVVGVNTAMLERGQGLSFATPIERVEIVVERLRAVGRFDRGFAGIVPKTVTRQDAATANLEDARGARVGRVVPDSPAAAAGLQPGDIILKFGAAEVGRPDDLPWLIAASPPGARVAVELVRGPERMRVELLMQAARE